MTVDDDIGKAWEVPVVEQETLQTWQDMLVVGSAEGGPGMPGSARFTWPVTWRAQPIKGPLNILNACRPPRSSRVHCQLDPSLPGSCSNGVPRVFSEERDPQASSEVTSMTLCSC